MSVILAVKICAKMNSLEEKRRGVVICLEGGDLLGYQLESHIQRVDSDSLL